MFQKIVLAAHGPDPPPPHPPLRTIRIPVRFHAYPLHIIHIAISIFSVRFYGWNLWFGFDLNIPTRTLCTHCSLTQACTRQLKRWLEERDVRHVLLNT